MKKTPTKKTVSPILPFDPLADLFDLEDVDVLKESMQRLGFLPQFPIVTAGEGNKKRIIDGRRREQARHALGIEATHKKFQAERFWTILDSIYARARRRPKRVDRHASVVDGADPVDLDDARLGIDLNFSDHAFWGRFLRGVRKFTSEARGSRHHRTQPPRKLGQKASEIRTVPRQVYGCPGNRQ
jgi:ParB-like nuclease domain